MKKVSLLSAFLILLVFTSCEKEQSQESIVDQQLSIESTRVVFENWSEFEKTVKELGESDSYDYIMNWIFEKGHPSLYVNGKDSLDEDEFDITEDIPTGLLAIMNTDFEFQVGNKIVSYQNNTFYSSDFESAKNSVTREKIGESIVSYIPFEFTSPDKSDLNSKVNIWSNNRAALVQDDIFRKRAYSDSNCSTNGSSSSSKRKYRFRQMLKSVTTKISTAPTLPQFYLYELNLECKLYVNKRNGSNSYRYSGSRRSYRYNLSGNVKFKNYFQAFNINTTRCVKGTSSGPKFNRLNLFTTTDIYLQGNMELTGTGTVTHELSGNRASEKWTNSVNW